MLQYKISTCQPANGFLLVVSAYLVPPEITGSKQHQQGQNFVFYKLLGMMSDIATPVCLSCWICSHDFICSCRPWGGYHDKHRELSDI